jgi:methyl-accepting chemotaxis protein
VLETAGNVSDAAAQLAAEVQAFFVRRRNGPLDRRKADDPNYRGPDRRNRGGGAQQRAGSAGDRKIA